MQSGEARARSELGFLGVRYRVKRTRLGRGGPPLARRAGATVDRVPGGSHVRSQLRRKLALILVPSVGGVERSRCKARVVAISYGHGCPTDGHPD